MTVQEEQAQLAKVQLIDQIQKLDKAQLTERLEVLAMMIRAFEGKEVNPENDVITRLINVKNILERSNFPSMNIINFQVYCRLVAFYHPECEPFRKWADFQAESLKSYKALSSEQYVEMFKAQNSPGLAPGTNISFQGQQAKYQEQRKGLFRRNKKEPEYRETEE